MKETPENNGWRLARQVAAGDNEAFAVLLERYRRPVLGFVYRFLGDAEEAEDVAQEVFARVYRNLRDQGVKNQSGAFSSWLFQVARNAAIDRQRHRARRPMSSLSETGEGAGEYPSQGRNPHQEAVAGELEREIATAVGELPEKQRTALILYEYEGMSYGEIAAIMKCREKSVEARLYRARRYLRRRLADHL